VDIIKKIIKYNTSTRLDKIKYIVIHDTGNTSKGANAEMHYRFFNGGDRKSSADFFVDDKEIYQIVDYNNRQSWAVGDGKGKNGITNSNSISVEMCINIDSNRTLVVERTVELVKLLMEELNIPIENVVRHYDASGKICPGSMSKDDWKEWKEFKEKLKPKHWAEDSFTFLNNNGIIIHTRDFDTNITRGAVFVLLAQLVKLILRR
jgi:N-acetylmuramoyl-L-alanine amidase CwlA